MNIANGCLQLHWSRSLSQRWSRVPVLPARASRAADRPRPRPKRSPAAPPTACRRCSRKPTASRPDERTLLGDLRQLEVEREIKAEELRQLDARRRGRRAASSPASTSRCSASSARTSPRGPSCARASSSCTSSARAATSGCCSRRPTCGASARRRAWSRRWPSAIGTASTPHQRTPRRAEGVAHDARGARAANSRRSRVEAERAQSGGRPRRRGAQRDSSTNIDRAARSERAARGRAADRAAEAPADARATRIGAAAPAGPTPRPCRFGPFRGDLDWPVAGAVRQRFGRRHGRRVRRQTASRSPPTKARPCRPSTTARWLCRPVCRLRQPGHRATTRRQTFSLVRESERYRRSDAGLASSSGQTLGRSGASPTGAAGLYFELRVDGQPVDPLQWLKKR